MSWFSAAVDAVGSAVTSAATTTVNAAGDAANAVAAAAEAAAQAAAAAAAAAAQAAADAAAAIAAAAATVVNSVAAAADDAAAWAAAEAEALAIQAGEQVVQVIETADGMVQFICQDGSTWVMSAADYAAQQAQYAAEDAYYAAEAAASAAAEAVSDAAAAVGAAATDVAEAVGAAASGVGAAVEGAAEGVDEFVTGAGDAVQGVIEGGATELNKVFAGTVLEGATVLVTRGVTEMTNYVIDGAVNSVDSFTDTFEVPADLLQGDLEGVRDTVLEAAGEYVGVGISTDGRGVWEASFTTAVPGVSSVDTSIRGGITADGDAVVGGDVGVTIDTGVGGRASAGVGGDLSVGASGVGVELGVEEAVAGAGFEQSGSLAADASIGDPYTDLFEAGVSEETDLDTVVGGVHSESEVRAETTYDERGGLGGFEVTGRTEEEVEVLGNTVGAEFDVKVGLEERTFEDPVTGLAGVFEATAKTEVDTLFIDHTTESHTEAEVAVGLGISADVEMSHTEETTIFGTTSTTEVKADAGAELFTEEHIIGVDASVAASQDGPIDASVDVRADGALDGGGVTAGASADGSAEVLGIGGAVGEDVSVGMTGDRGLFVEGGIDAEVHTPVGGVSAEAGAGVEVDYSGGDIITGGTDGFGVRGAAHGGVGTVDAEGETTGGVAGAVAAEARTDDGVSVVGGVFDTAPDIAPDTAEPVDATPSAPTTPIAVRHDALGEVDPGPDPDPEPQAAPSRPSVFAAAPATSRTADVRRQVDDAEDDVRRTGPDRVAATHQNGDDRDDASRELAAVGGGASLGAFAAARDVGGDADGSTLGDFGESDPLEDAARQAEKEGVLDQALDGLEDLGDSVTKLIDDLNPFD